MKFEEVEKVFYKWLHIEDPDYLKVINAVVLSHRMSAPPVWMLILGPPSGTKTVPLETFVSVKDVYPVNIITPNTFLSGGLKGVKREKENLEFEEPSLLLRIKSGIITMKDFTTIISMKEKLDILQQLREIYDGHLVKNTGFAKAMKMEWKGKITLLAGCTEVYDMHREIDQTLGERFLFYRHYIKNRAEMAKKATFQVGYYDKMRSELEDVVTQYHKEIIYPESITDIIVSYDIAEKLNHFADFLARGRSNVVRDYRHEIIQVPSPELPARLRIQLDVLIRALVIINDTKAVTEEELRIIERVGIMTLQPDRYQILKFLLSNNDRYHRTSDVTDGVNYIDIEKGEIGKKKLTRNIILRSLETLHCYGLVEKTEVSDTIWEWAVSELTKKSIAEFDIKKSVSETDSERGKNG